MNEIEKRVLANPKYQELIRKRTPYGWIMISIMFFVYYGFVLLVAFAKGFISTPIASDMTTTWGIPLGVGVILTTIILTGLYVRRANAEFDPLVNDIVREAQK
ncbi:DUF485 domain-containing protein [Phaeovibrio sulfidiphilus]|uniref:DUF485 domain-containing protein n=1 Tax=Phaeovibrio sulfidiphilus TaxID=1220600 RepID=A0A8J7CWK5_9PROT|nr:DUF485 domain-containing protein [Phaeovibrio sulfidiphilus]MBE1237606.1 DUF485 domain-containing protein [Phaeovibrio sulfidiphilus]